VSSLEEHLRSPQFPGEDPALIDEVGQPGRSVARFTGGWVSPGQPRWKAYAMYGAGIIVGLILALTSTGGFDVIAMAGVALIAFGLVGVVETLRGKHFPRL
jgi:hypothetical protein